MIFYFTLQEEQDTEDSNPSSDDDDSDSDEESDDYFSSGLGKFVTYLGMNLVEEHVQGFLLKNKTRQYDKDKDSEKLQTIASLKKKLVKCLNII